MTQNRDKTFLNRRQFLGSGVRSGLGISALALAAGSTPFASALQRFGQHLSDQRSHSSRLSSPYGGLVPVKDEATGLELLQLPRGFRYTSFSWTGDLMEDGSPVPPGHDGMGVVASEADTGEIILIRNHELGAGRLIAAPARYDVQALPDGGHAAGGNTTVYFPGTRLSRARTVPSLGGTLANCAGGVTPWGSWLSCEETVTDNSGSGGRRHGYVFEVGADPALTVAEPIVGMGRFRHEAVAIDPATGAVYLTEDNRNLSPLYRFLPRDTSQRIGALHNGGVLQAARIKGRHRADLLTPVPGEEHELEWVPVPDPDMSPVGAASGPCLQARDAGALSLSRGEGIRYADGLIYIVDTSAGKDEKGRPGYGNGAVWLLDPATDRLRCLFVSPDAFVGNNPDNVTVSPRGGVVLCEDGGGVEDEYGFGERILGLTAEGDCFLFAKNNIILSETDIHTAGKTVQPGDYRNREIAGACFDASGDYLFFNIQTPGITFAVWGPWQEGPL